MLLSGLRRRRYGSTTQPSDIIGNSNRRYQPVTGTCSEDVSCEDGEPSCRAYSAIEAPEAFAGVVGGVIEYTRPVDLKRD